MVLYDYVQITHTNTIDVSEDVVCCFDQMIEVFKNLSCQQGVDVQYLHLHANSQKQFQYYVKHAQGVLKQFNHILNRTHGMVQTKVQATPV